MDTTTTDCYYCQFNTDCMPDSNGKMSCSSCYDNDLGVAKYSILASPTLSQEEIEKVQRADAFDEVIEVVKTKGNGTISMFLSRLQTGFKYAKHSNALIDLRNSLIKKK